MHQVSLPRRAPHAVSALSLAMVLALGCDPSNAQTSATSNAAGGAPSNAPGGAPPNTPSTTPLDAANKATAEAESAPKSSATSTASPGEPGTRRMVIEDDNTRIEELHVRGEAQRVVVQPKRTNLPAWEIRPDSPGRTFAGEQRLPRDTANTRMWRVMSF